jgi:hypothetical protein
MFVAKIKFYYLFKNKPKHLQVIEKKNETKCVEKIDNAIVQMK